MSLEIKGTKAQRHLTLLLFLATVSLSLSFSALADRPMAEHFRERRLASETGVVVLPPSAVPAGALELKRNPLPMQWQNEFCKKTNDLATCLLAQSYHWLRSIDLIFDPALLVAKGGATIWSIAAILPYLYGPNTSIKFILMASSRAFASSAVVFGGAVAAALAGATLSAGIIYFGQTGSIGTPYLNELEGDSRLLAACGNIDVQKEISDLEHFMQLSPEQLDKLLPCIPRASPLFEQMGQAATQGQAAQKLLRP